MVTLRLVNSHALAVLLKHFVFVIGFSDPNAGIVNERATVQLLNDNSGILGSAVRVSATFALLFAGPRVDGFSEVNGTSRNFKHNPLKLLNSGSIRQLTQEQSGEAALGIWR